MVLELGPREHKINKCLEWVYTTWYHRIVTMLECHFLKTSIFYIFKLQIANNLKQGNNYSSAWSAIPSFQTQTVQWAGSAWSWKSTNQIELYLKIAFCNRSLPAFKWMSYRPWFFSLLPLLAGSSLHSMGQHQYTKQSVESSEFELAANFDSMTGAVLGVWALIRHYVVALHVPTTCTRDPLVSDILQVWGCQFQMIHKEVPTRMRDHTYTTFNQSSHAVSIQPSPVIDWSQLCKT